MTEVSVETCFANLRVLSFSLKFWNNNCNHIKIKGMHEIG